MPKMRAKLYVTGIEERFSGDTKAGNSKSSETLHMSAVAAKEYPADGSDEDNTYAKWSPNATFTICVNNPALFGQFKVGEKYYVDFTQAAE